MTDIETPAPRSWDLYAHKTERTPPYAHIGSRRHTGLHGSSHPIVPVTVVEDPDGPYRGWIPTENPERPSLNPGTPVFIQRDDFFILAFTDPPEVQQADGKGVIVQLRVEERS